MTDWVSQCLVTRMLVKIPKLSESLPMECSITNHPIEDRLQEAQVDYV